MKNLSEYIIESGTPGIEVKDDVIKLMMSMQDQGIFEVKETEGEYTDLRYEMHYKHGLIHWIEFVNDWEYLDGYTCPDGTSLANNSSDEVDRTDWESLLDSRIMIPKCINNSKKIMNKESGRATRYKNIYDRNGKGSAYDEYLRAKNRAGYLEVRIEKYQKLSKYI